MAAWCLPKPLSQAFQQWLKDGGEELPGRLMEMTSEARRAEFAKILGAENAHEVNAQFEEKMLLKDQQRGMITWAKNVAGLKEPVRRDILAKINRLDKVLNPAEEQAFLEDLAAKKLGISVTREEAQQVFQFSQKAEQLKQAVVADVKGGGWGGQANEAYGRALIDLTNKIESLKPKSPTDLRKIAGEIASIPVSIATAGHLSAPGVQGWGLISTPQAWQGIWQMLRYFSNEDAYVGLNAQIAGHPYHDLLTTGLKQPLGITHLLGKLTGREEAIQSSLLERGNQYLKDKTGLPNLIRAGSRAFTGYLNYVRFSTAVKLVDALKMRGFDVSKGSEDIQDIVKFVNDFTGRGASFSTGVVKSAEIPQQVLTAANYLLFSPRKNIGMIEMFNPIRYLDPRINPVARQAATRNLLGSILVTGTVLGLLKATGVQINLNPVAQYFLKPAIGDTHLDLTGGNDNYARLWARMIAQREVTGTGKDIKFGQGFNAPTTGSVLWDFMRGRLAPVASIIADGLYGPIGASGPAAFNLPRELAERLPIAVSNIVGVALNDPGNNVALVASLAGIFGIGVEPPHPADVVHGMDVWGNPAPDLGTSPGFKNDPIVQEAKRVGLSLHFPPDKIRGVQLTDAQYNRYIQLSGQLAHQRLTDLIGSDVYAGYGPKTQLNKARGAITGGRNEAQNEMITEGELPPKEPADTTQ